MASTVFVYLSIEAYANDLGPRACPDEWADERAFFASGDFQGTLGKLAYLAKTLEVPLHRDRRPFQTLKTLEKRRHMVVHGRTHVVDEEVQFLDPRELKAVEPEIYDLADEDFLDRALEDAENFCDQLQNAAQRSLGEHVIRWPRAFRGVIGHQGGWIEQPLS